MIDSKIKHLLNGVIGHSHMYRKQLNNTTFTEINPNYLDTKKKKKKKNRLEEQNC